MINHAEAFIPVDIVAARTMYEGEPTINRVDTHGRHTRFQPETRCYSGPKEFDMTGRRFGSFVVVGYSILPSNEKGSRLVCRCDCGRYEIRHSRTARNPKNIEDCCSDCHATKRARERGGKVWALRIAGPKIEEPEEVGG